MMENDTGLTPDPASELPLLVLIWRLLWQVKWLLLLCSTLLIILEQFFANGTAGAVLAYSFLFAVSLDVARQPDLRMPKQWTFRPAIFLPGGLMLVVGLFAAALVFAFVGSAFAAIIGVHVALGFALAVLAPWLIGVMAPERTKVRIGLLGRLWRLQLVAVLVTIWLVLSLLLLAHVVGDANAAIAVPVAILVRTVADVAIVAHAAILAAAVVPSHN